MRKRVTLFLAASLLLAQAPRPDTRALGAITAGGLKGDLSFLASDLLEGRGTPSRGQDIAAEFIASRFRAAGLEPAGDDDYFQTAHMVLQRPRTEGAWLAVHHGKKTITVSADKIGAMAEGGLDIAGAAVVKVDLAAGNQDTTGLKGKVVVAGFGGAGSGGIRRLQQSGVAMILLPGRLPMRRMAPRPLDPSRPKSAPMMFADDDALRTLVNELPPGPASITVDAKLPRPEETPVKLRNVVGVLRGSDPVLRESFVIVSAHYDHLGVDSSGSGDTIYNGANDDASGTASLIGIAQALSALPARPRRSVVFLAVFGEELGLLGSRYYADHPVLPLAKTVADLNLEQTGRTDEQGGPVLKRIRITGEDYSDVVKTLDRAGELTGVRVDHEPQRSDDYFARSDNLTFAERGIPAHTVCVAYTYPDYHGVGDHWDKIDYENMAAVTRTLAEAVLLLADAPEGPHWNRDNPGALRYRR